jgi:hypothetical protein
MKYDYNFADIRLSWWFIVDADHTVWYLNHFEAGCVDISEVGRPKDSQWQRGISPAILRPSPIYDAQFLTFFPSHSHCNLSLSRKDHNATYFAA